MTDEEKKAIEYLKIHILPYYGKKGVIEFMLNDILLNLIKKQSKEIEELSDKLIEKICKGVEEEILEEYRQTIIRKDKEIEELKDKYSDEKIRNTVIKRYKEVIEKDYVSKDKIKAKIEVLEKLQKEFPNNDEIRIKIIAYKELLEKE